MLIDEAHHVLPAERDPSAPALLTVLPTIVLVTVDPQAVARAAWDCVDDLFVVGEKAAETSKLFAGHLQFQASPCQPNRPSAANYALAPWAR